MNIKIKVNGKRYFLCRSCGIYKKDKFADKIKNQKFCITCLGNYPAQKTKQY